LTLATAGPFMLLELAKLRLPWPGRAKAIEILD
jgi:hypothetical protein